MSNLEEVLKFLDKEDKGGLQEFLASLSAADTGNLLQSLDLEKRRRVFQLFSGFALRNLLKKLLPAEIVSLVSSFPVDEIADVLAEVHSRRREKILIQFSPALSEKVQRLLFYGKDTAGSIMALDFIAFDVDSTVHEVIEGIRKISPDQEKAFYVYVVDNEKKLLGVLSMRDLVIRTSETKVRDILRTNVITVSAQTDQEEVVRMFHKHKLLALPVVDISKLVGVVTVDDVADIIQKEATEDFLKISGIPSGEESIHSPLSQAIKNRLPWLALNMLLDCIAVSVVAIYQGTIQAVVAIAVLMPIISDMGGNTGFQSMSLIVRGFAMGEVTLKDFLKIFRKQFFLGIFNGFVLGLEIAILAYLWKWNPMLGLVAGLAMWINIFFAAIIGALIPLGLKAIKFDPAVATGPILTTLTDFVGFFATLQLANSFIKYLM